MTLLQMSLQGGAMILAAMVLRALLINRLPKRAFLALWYAALVRLLVPFELPAAFSLYNLPVGLSKTGIGNAAGITAAPPAALYGTATANTAGGAGAISGLTLLWAAGAIVCAVFFAAAYRHGLRKFRASLPVQNEFCAQWLKAHPLKRPLSIRQSGRVASPLTYGVLRPVILLPAQTDFTDTATLQYVLQHEYTHIRRFDNLAKLFFAAALCLHWFNPMVWAMYILANRDIELACDEAVVRAFGLESRAAYACALIQMEEARSSFLPLCSCFSKSAAEERIVSIMKTKNKTLTAALASCALVAAVVCTLATSACAGGHHIEEEHHSASQTASVSQTNTTHDYSAASQENSSSGAAVSRSFSVYTGEDGKLYCRVYLANGSESTMGPCESYAALYKLVEPFCSKQVELGNMTQTDADCILGLPCFANGGSTLNVTAQHHADAHHSSHHE